MHLLLSILSQFIQLLYGLCGSQTEFGDDSMSVMSPLLAQGPRRVQVILLKRLQCHTELGFESLIRCSGNHCARSASVVTEESQCVENVLPSQSPGSAIYPQ